MYNNLRKYSSSFLSVFKIALVLLSLFFIYNKLLDANFQSVLSNLGVLKHLILKNFWFFIFILCLTDLNWFLESFKWKKLVNTYKKITFFDAFEQCLAAQTAAIFTPNRIGEFGIKIWYFKKEFHKKIVGLTIVSNFTQLLATLLFGLYGIYFLVTEHHFFNAVELNLNLLIVLITVITICILAFVVLKKVLPNWFQRFSIFLNAISKKTYLQIQFLSIARYLVFSHQFYFLLVFLNLKVSYFETMPLIFSMYFLASMLPTFAFFDWAIKGSISILLFQLIGINELVIITVTTLMWLANSAIPAVLGSFFVLNLKPEHTP